MVRLAFVAATLLAAISVAAPAKAQFVYGRSVVVQRFGGSHFSFGLGIAAPYNSFYYSSGYPYSGYPYYGPYGYGNGYPYGTYYNPGSGYLSYYLPPVYQPAELAYGPQAMQRFAGPPAVDPFGGVPGGLAAPRVATKLVEPKPEEARPAVRVSNLEARRRAVKFIESGDELFRAQRYHEALQKYKSAAEAAPDVAEVYFRQGHALTATARYELAAAAFKRGAAIGPEWAESVFRLDSIYGDAEIAKTSHLENLAHAVLEKPADGDLVFVLAMFLHYDGDSSRAVRLFQRVVDLAGKDVPYVRPFLPAGGAPAKPADDVVPKAELPGIEA
jgi:tetratricopeptide (TPR) repeat protein